MHRVFTARRWRGWAESSARYWAAAGWAYWAHACGRTMFISCSTGKVREATPRGLVGILVVRLQLVTGRTQVQHIGGHSYAGKWFSGLRAHNIGLLKGLRMCKQSAWFPVHVAGNNKTILSQHERRMAPRAAKLKSCYWAARRTADAVGVHSWTTVPRERCTPSPR
jgi:hypothetical protein